MQEFEEKIRDLITTKRDLVIDGKVYEIRIDIAKTIKRLEHGQTVRITNTERNVDTMLQYIHSIKNAGKIKECKINIGRDLENKVTYITKY